MVQSCSDAVKALHCHVKCAVSLATASMTTEERLIRFDTCILPFTLHYLHRDRNSFRELVSILVESVTALTTESLTSARERNFELCSCPSGMPHCLRGVMTQSPLEMVTRRLQKIKMPNVICLFTCVTSNICCTNFTCKYNCN